MVHGLHVRAGYLSLPGATGSEHDRTRAGAGWAHPHPELLAARRIDGPEQSHPRARLRYSKSAEDCVLGQGRGAVRRGDVIRRFRRPDPRAFRFERPTPRHQTPRPFGDSKTSEQRPNAVPPTSWARGNTWQERRCMEPLDNPQGFPAPTRAELGRRKLPSPRPRIGVAARSSASIRSTPEVYNPCRASRTARWRPRVEQHKVRASGGPAPRAGGRVLKTMIERAASPAGSPGGVSNFSLARWSGRAAARRSRAARKFDPARPRSHPRADGRAPP